MPESTFDPSSFMCDDQPRLIIDVLKDVMTFWNQSGLDLQGETLGDATWMMIDKTALLYGLQVDENGKALWPARYQWILCSAVKGGSEGYWVHIATVEQNEDALGTKTYRLLGMIKLWDWTLALRAADMAATLFQMNQPYARYDVRAKPA